MEIPGHPEHKKTTANSGKTQAKTFSQMAKPEVRTVGSGCSFAAKMANVLSLVWCSVP